MPTPPVSERRSPALVAVALAALVAVAGCSVGPFSTETPTQGRTPTAGGTPSETATPTPSPATGTLEVHYINVGQAAAILVVGPANETMLVDSGRFRDDGEHVLRYLRRHGVDRIDHFVVSHAHPDHVGGADEVVEHYETEADGVGRIYDPGLPANSTAYEEYVDAVERHDVERSVTREGDRVPFTGVDVSVLGPPDPYVADGDLNENNVVLKLEHGDASFLFVGDAEFTQELHLVEHYGDELDATVLQVGHHGSQTSTGDALLDSVRPEAAVVSSAYDSPFGHPHDAPLERLANHSVATYWTGVHGDVVFRSDGAAVSVYTQRPATTRPLELRSADPVSPAVEEDVDYRTTVPARPGADRAPPAGAATARPPENRVPNASALSP